MYQMKERKINMSELVILGMTFGAFALGSIVTAILDKREEIMVERAKKSPNNPKYNKWREEV